MKKEKKIQEKKKKTIATPLLSNWKLKIWNANKTIRDSSKLKWWQFEWISLLIIFLVLPIDQQQCVRLGWKGGDCSLLGGRDCSTSIRKLQHLPQPPFVLKKMERPNMLTLIQPHENNWRKKCTELGCCVLYTPMMEWSSTILLRRAPTKESPAPVVSTVFTWNGSTAPRKFWQQTKAVSSSRHIPLGMNVINHPTLEFVNAKETYSSNFSEQIRKQLNETWPKETTPRMAHRLNLVVATSRYPRASNGQNQTTNDK